MPSDTKSVPRACLPRSMARQELRKDRCGVSFIVRNAGSLRQQSFEFDLVAAPASNFSVTGARAPGGGF